MKNAYRACAEISLDALQHNIEQIKSKINSDTKLMCVIKANAYGHGSVVLARELLKMGADSFAVATVDEGIELRENGIQAPILILGKVSSEEYKAVVENDLMPAVCSYASAKDLEIVARDLGKTVKVHIKIDTGMSRIGFKADDDSVKSITMINSLFYNIQIDGIFTHFSCADCLDDEMTRKQAEAFMSVINKLEENGVHIPCKHCANSASIMRYPFLQMNMVRAGIIIYGLYPSDEVDKSLLDLQPVMSLKSRVTCIKVLEKGKSIGYGATYESSRDSKIATVSIGYADGYPRAMSNRGRVLIDSNSYPIVGRICMDQLMVDVTDSDNEIMLSDEVVLVGNQGSETIPVEEVANQSASFNYEFVCDVSRRVPRVYYRNGEVVEVVNYLSSPKKADKSDKDPKDK